MSVSRTPETETPPSGRTHGDSYSDVLAHDEEYTSTASTHGRPADRRAEEPSEAALGERKNGA